MALRAFNALFNLFIVIYDEEVFLMQEINRLVIGFDQALNTSGVAVFGDGKLLEHTTFTAEKGTDFDRFTQQKDWAVKYVEDTIDKYQPKGFRIGIEQIQQQRNVITFKQLAGVQAVLGSALEAEFNLEVEIVSAASWKSTCDIKGKSRPEQKRNAQVFVENLYGVKPTQDAVDAICLAHHLAKSKVFFS